MDKKKKISRSFITIIVFVACILGSYLCVENLKFSRNFSNVLSLIGLGLILFFIYLSIKNKHFYEKEILLCFIEICIINRLYDALVYKEILPYPVKYIILGIVIIYILRFSIPLLSKAVIWIFENIEEKPQKVKNNQVIKKKRYVGVEDYPNVNIEDQINGQKGNKNKDTASKKKDRSINLQEIILFLIMSVIIIVLAFHSLTTIFTENKLLQNRIKNIPGSYNEYISFILLIVLFIILIGIALVCCFKFLQILLDIILRRNSPGSIMFYVLGSIVLSLFLNQKGYLSQDKILDFIVSSDIFALPVFGLICYLVFLLCGSAFNNIMSFDNVKVSAKGIVKDILKIARGIIDSIIRIFSFLTNDMLAGFLELIGNDDFEGSKNKIESTDKKNNERKDNEKE